jgi:hypothetical protein
MLSNKVNTTYEECSKVEFLNYSHTIHPEAEETKDAHVKD